MTGPLYLSGHKFGQTPKMGPGGGVVGSFTNKYLESSNYNNHWSSVVGHGGAGGIKYNSPYTLPLIYRVVTNINFSIFKLSSIKNLCNNLRPGQ